MPRQKIHSGKAREGLGQSREAIDHNLFVEGPAKLTVKIRLTEDENAQSIGMDEIDIELVEAETPQQEQQREEMGIEQFRQGINDAFEQIRDKLPKEFEGTDEFE